LKNVFLAEINKLKDFEEIYSIGEETQRKLRGSFPKDGPITLYSKSTDRNGFV